MTTVSEIERKFLFQHCPLDLSKLEVRSLRQGYLALEKDREVRIRDENGTFSLTVKIGTGLVKSETEILISSEQFEVFWPVTEGRRLEKDRYFKTLDDAVLHVDIYHGDFEGLKVAEIEFPSESHAKNFETLDWFGLEVTELDYREMAQLKQQGKWPLI